MQRGRHLLNAAEFSGPEVIWDVDSGNVFSGQTSLTFQLVFGMSDSMCQKWKSSSRLLPTKIRLCDGMGVHQYPRHGCSAYMWRYHWCGGICSNFGETYAAVKDDDFSMNPCLFQQDNAILHKVQQRSFVGIELMCLTGLPAAQICLLLKINGTTWRGESDCWAAQVLIHQECEKNSTCKTAQNWKFPNDYKA